MLGFHALASHYPLQHESLCLLPLPNDHVANSRSLIAVHEHLAGEGAYPDTTPRHSLTMTEAFAVRPADDRS